MVDGTESDQKKFAYHGGADIMRNLQERICERTFTKTAFSDDEGETSLSSAGRR
jgi:hypothetical protein